MYRDAELYLILFMFFLGIMCIAAYIRHLLWVISKLASDAGITVGQIVLSILGTLMPPLGTLHGFMLFFGMGMG